jgi:hypothetical protein
VVWCQEQELVAAEAAQHAVRQQFGEALRHPLQGLVARVVAVSVVDLLEAVQVHEKQREATSALRCLRDVLLRTEHAAAPVEQAGQGIMRRLMLQRLLLATPVADVLKQDRESFGAGVGSHFQPFLQRRIGFREGHRLTAAHSPLTAVVERAVNGPGELLPDVLADQVRAGLFQNHFSPRVDVHQPPVLVHRHERIGDALDDRLRSLLQRRDLRFRRLAFGRVAADADHLAVLHARG